MNHVRVTNVASRHGEPWTADPYTPSAAWMAARYVRPLVSFLPVLSEMAQSEPAIQLYVDFLKDNERGIIRA